MGDLHIINRPRDTCANVVFVHGLGGHWRNTWHPNGIRSRFSFWNHSNWWPQWLADDLPRVAVLSLSYPAPPIRVPVVYDPGMPLFSLARNLLRNIDEYDVFALPTVFICHSFGGIVIKQILRLVAEEGRDLKDNIRGIAFLGTPHHGSLYANLVAWLPIAGDSVRDLRSNAPYLLDLNRWFAKTYDHLGPAILDGHEPLHHMRFLTLASGTCGIPSSDLLPLDKKHARIPKPHSKFSLRYKAVYKLIATAIEPSQSEIIRTTEATHIKAIEATRTSPSVLASAKRTFGLRATLGEILDYVEEHGPHLSPSDRNSTLVLLRDRINVVPIIGIWVRRFSNALQQLITGCDSIFSLSIAYQLAKRCGLHSLKTSIFTTILSLPIVEQRDALAFLYVARQEDEDIKALGPLQKWLERDSTSEAVLAAFFGLVKRFGDEAECSSAIERGHRWLGASGGQPGNTRAIVFEAWLDLSVTCGGWGALRQAVRSCELWFEDDAWTHNAWVAWVSALITIGNVEMAKDWVERGLSSFPRSRNLKAMYATVAEMLGDEMGVECSLRELVANNGSDFGMVGKLGDWLMRRDRWKEAADVFESAVKLDPQHYDFRVQLGFAYLYSGRNEEALLQFEVALNDKVRHRSKQGRVLAEVGYAQALSMAGQFSRAKQVFFEAAAKLRRFPELRARTYFEMGIAAVNWGQLGLARGMFRRARRADPSEPKYLQAESATRAGIVQGGPKELFRIETWIVPTRGLHWDIREADVTTIQSE